MNTPNSAQITAPAQVPAHPAVQLIASPMFAETVPLIFFIFCKHRLQPTEFFKINIHAPLSGNFYRTVVHGVYTFKLRRPTDSAGSFLR